MKTLILDNYDSFTFNLYQYIGELGGNPVVHRNDKIDLSEVERLGVSHIVISPGPGNPYTERDIGISEKLIDYAAKQHIPLLGVCLGHQVLAKHFGATVSRVPKPFHGKTSKVRHESNSALFKGIDREFDAMRYHSLCAEKDTVSHSLRITASSEDGVIMAIEHTELPLYGIQFHPESIGTPVGKEILRNFLSVSKKSPSIKVHTLVLGKTHMSTTLFTQSAFEQIKTLLSEKCEDAEREAIFNNLVQQPISADVLTDGVRALRESMIPLSLSSYAIDTCGTGGSGLKTINTSSLTAFIVAAAGGKVAKHGNRSASGNCGCFDLLEELGVNIHLNPDEERRVFERLGIAFLYAQLHHPALRFVAPLRKKYGKKTLFNLIGPLCNPAGVKQQLIGTAREEDAQIIAKALQMLGSVGSIVVTGHDGLDEVTVTDTTTVRYVREENVEIKEFSPASLSIKLALPHEIEGGTAKENAALFLELAQGKGTAAMRSLILINAAHALLLTPLVTKLEDAFLLAKKTLNSGAAYEAFRLYRDFTKQL